MRHHEPADHGFIAPSHYSLKKIQSIQRIVTLPKPGDSGLVFGIDLRAVQMELWLTLAVDGIENVHDTVPRSSATYLDNNIEHQQKAGVLVRSIYRAVHSQIESLCSRRYSTLPLVFGG